MKKLIFTLLWVLVAILGSAFLTGVVSFARAFYGHDLSLETWPATALRCGPWVLGGAALLLGLWGKLPGTRKNCVDSGGMGSRDQVSNTPMYSVDDNDRVEELNVPQSSVGAPCPMLLAGEQWLVLAYYLQNTPKGWDGTTVKVVDENTAGEPVAVIHFKLPYAHFFGPPNDEAFAGHPLASRGLRPYGVFEVRQSSWIRRLERMNSVHPCHRPDQFAELRHFIFSFHDTTFECVAREFTITGHGGSVADVLKEAWPRKREERYPG